MYASIVLVFYIRWREVIRGFQLQLLEALERIPNDE